MPTIQVTKRANDIKANIKKTKHWDAGETTAAAIGRLIMTAPEQFRIKIEYENSFPQDRLPYGARRTGEKAKICQRIARYAHEYNAQLVRYKNLPKECQYAIAHYMAVDGEAWEIPNDILKKLQTMNGFSYDSPDYRKAKKAFMQLFQKRITFYVDSYGEVEFGYIAEMSMQTLITDVMTTSELNTDWGALGGWKQYHKWYMENAPKHKATSNLWPVILCSFYDEILEDGWTRFHQYADRGLETCPAIFFPNTRS